MKTKTARKPNAPASVSPAAPERKWRAWFFASPEEQGRLTQPGFYETNLTPDCIILRRVPRTENEQNRVGLLIAAAYGSKEAFREEGVVAVDVGIVCATPGGVVIGGPALPE